MPTVSKSVEVSTKKHHRSVHFSYADGGSEFPADLVQQLSVLASDGMTRAVAANGYVNATNLSGLTEAEITQLHALLDKLFDAAIAAASDPPAR